MPIYVDPLFTCQRSAAWPYDKASHMATDGTIEELHEFASRIGLAYKWFQDKVNHPHYDLTPGKRALAVRSGAIEVDSRELLVKCFPALSPEPKKNKPKIYTAGYGAPGTLEQIDAWMKDPDCILMDIRASRRTDYQTFTKEALTKRFGDRYRHASGLGNKNYQLRGTGAPIELVKPEPAIAKIVEMFIIDQKSFVLLCGCKDYSACHRKEVEEMIRREINAFYEGLNTED